MISLSVPLPGGREYPVFVGPGERSQVNELLPQRAQRVAIITQANIPVTLEVDREHRVFTIGDGEAHKSLTTIEQLCSDFADWGLTRTDVVVGLGGGLVTDVAGFAAAVYHRGVGVIQVPTTLLGQIDAAIGGKTGVNLPQGKNLVGAFWQPEAVVCDTEVLTSLPDREWKCGYGELAKYHWLGGGQLDALSLPEQVAACVDIKAQIVASDERESGRRALLNYGHTLAHAIEIAGGHDLRHGEAVAIGLIYAAELAYALGRISEPDIEEHHRVIKKYDLPNMLPAHLDSKELLALMGRDKKVLDQGLTFVLDGPDGVEVISGVDPDIVLQTIDTMRAKQSTRK